MRIKISYLFLFFSFSLSAQKSFFLDDKGILKDRFVMPHIYFQLNSEVILQDSYPYLDSLAVEFDKYKLLNIEIGCHTDNRLSPYYATKLSQKRSESIRKYLIQKVSENIKIIALGYDAVEPIASNETAKGRQLNRRIEIKVLDKGKRAENTINKFDEIIEIEKLYIKGQKALIVQDSNASVFFSEAYSLAKKINYPKAKIIFWLSISYKESNSPYASAFLFRRIDFETIKEDANILYYKKEYKKLKKWLNFKGVKNTKHKITNSEEDLALKADDIYRNEKLNGKSNKLVNPKFKTCFLQDSIL